MIRIFKTILLLCALLCFIFAISSCGEEPRSTHPERQNIDTLAYSMPQALRVVPGTSWARWNSGDSILLNGFALMSQDAGNSKERIVTDSAVLAWLVGVLPDSLALSGYADTLRLSNDTLYISGQNYVLLSDYLDNTDAQTLTATSIGDSLSVSGGNSILVPHRLYGVDSLSEIYTKTFPLGATIMNRANMALYKVQASAVSGYTTDSIAVIPSGGRYAVLQPASGRYDIRWFGADNTSANDIAALKKAMDMCKAIGELHLYYPPGIFHADGYNNISGIHHFTIEGSGKNATTLMRGSSRQWFGFENSSNITIRDIGFHANGNTNFGGISILETDIVTIENCYFFDEDTNFVNWKDTTTNKVDVYAFVIRQSTTQSNFIKFNNNIVKYLQVEFGPVHNFEISNNYLTKGRVTGQIWLGSFSSNHYITNGLVSGNTIVDPFGMGIGLNQDANNQDSVFFKDIKIVNNTVLFQDTSINNLNPALRVGSTKSTSQDHYFENIEISNNLFRAAAPYEMQNEFIWIVGYQSAEVFFDGLTFSNNIVIIDDTGNTYNAVGIRKVSNASINNNLIISGSNGLVLGDTSNNLQISNNHVIAQNDPYIIDISVGTNNKFSPTNTPYDITQTNVPAGMLDFAVAGNTSLQATNITGVLTNTSEARFGNVTDQGSYTLQSAGDGYNGGRWLIFDSDKTPSHTVSTTNLEIQSSNAQSADRGGSLAFGGYINTAQSTKRNFGIIQGAKENSSENNARGYMSFHTLQNGSLGEVMRMNSNNETTITGKLDMTTTTSGFVPPRLTTTQRNSVTAVQGMIIYNITVDSLQVRTSSTWRNLNF